MQIKSRNIFFIVIALFILIVVLFWRSKIPVEKADSAPVSLETLKNLSPAEISKYLPFMVDEHTRWDDMRVSGKQVIYDYTFVSRSINDMDTAAFNARIKGMLQKEICGNPETREVLEKGYSNSFRDHDKNGAEIATVELHQADCR